MTNDRDLAALMIAFGLILAFSAGFSFERQGDPAVLLFMLGVGLFLAVGGVFVMRGPR